MLRGISDDINKYTLKLGELKSQRDKQRLAEEALRELRENLTQLQADLKVGTPALFGYVKQPNTTRNAEVHNNSCRISRHQLKLLKGRGGKKTMLSIVTETNARMRKMKLLSKWGFTSQVLGRLNLNIELVNRE